LPAAMTQFELKTLYLGLYPLCPVPVDRGL